ncbi:MAG: glycosyltransferase family 87 protein [Chloroflexi bacterium]|nr:glycosyltransferase family 87 protein [Chloroflexota bacterium]
MAPRKKNIDLVWTNRDRSVEARLVALIGGINFLDDPGVQGDAESICSIRVRVDSDPGAARRIARRLEQLPGFDVTISSISTEWQAEAVMFTATGATLLQVPEVESPPEPGDPQAAKPDREKLAPTGAIPGPSALSEPQQPPSSSDRPSPEHRPTDSRTVPEPKVEWSPAEPLATSLKWNGSSSRTKTLVIIGIAFHLVMLASLFTGWLNLMSNDTHRRPQAADFFSIYQGSSNLYHGRSVYETGGFEPDVPYSFAYRYIPSVAYTFAGPFLLVEPWNAYWIWIAILEVLMLFNIVLTRQMASSPNRANIATAMWLLFTPLYAELFMGQFSFAMGSLFMWMMFGMWKLQPRLAQWSWIGSILLKTNSLLFAPALLRNGQFKVLVLAGVIFALLNAPYFAFHTDDVSELLDRNSGTGNTIYTETFDAGGVGGQALASIVGYTLEGRFEDGTAAPTTLALREGPPPGWEFNFLWLMGPGVIFGALVATFLVRRFDLLLNLTIWISVYLIVFKDVWEHHYLMLLPFLVLLFVRGRNGSTAALITWAVLALPTAHVFIEWWIIAFEPAGISRDASFDPQVYWPTGLSVLYHATKPVPLILFYLFLLRNSFSTGQFIPFRTYMQRGFSAAGYFWGAINTRLPLESQIKRAGRLAAKLAPSD